ncbi:MAG: AAA family ATPase [Aggregatilineales bacterium]
MLTQLHFKNWRTLRDVKIDNMTPITVFIGANSSGKTNILDALHFLRRATTNGIVDSVQAWDGRRNIRFAGATDNDEIVLAYSFKARPDLETITSQLAMKFEGQDIPFSFRSHLQYGPNKLSDDGYMEVPLRDFRVLPAIFIDEKTDELFKQLQIVSELIKRNSGKRWQLLKENFAAPTSIESNQQLDSYSIAPDASNVPRILELMSQAAPEVYEELQADLLYLLPHITRVHIDHTENRIKLRVNERTINIDAPTVSAGTNRILSMLTAYHVLSIPTDDTILGLPKDSLPYVRTVDLPGLVVIEEPDTAIHPLLLGNLVELLRSYTERKEPRQFILTTHNPQLLNYFQPEEVRLVERDPGTGETYVDTIPDSIKEIWLPKHRLGEAWTSRVLGGIPEE